MALERRFGVTIDEGAYADAKRVCDLKRTRQRAGSISSSSASCFGRNPSISRVESLEMGIRGSPRESSTCGSFHLRGFSAWVRAEGLENLRGLEPPVIFAPNHQSHLDIPALMHALPAKWRYRVAPAMSKEFFDAHFHPERHGYRRTLH